MSIITDICSMYILLAAATTLEIQPTIHFLEKNRFRLSGQETGILITGVGSLATTHSLMRQTRQRRPDLLLQAGIAGCFTGKQPGELVAIREEVLDLGVWENSRFKNLFDLHLAGRDTPPFTGGMLINPYDRLLSLSALEPARSLTVNEITTEPARIAWYQQNLSPVVESMEGGALHYTCLLENIPFLQLRSVSNAIGIRDKTKWDIPQALRRLNEAVTALLIELSGQEKSILNRSA